MQIVLFGLPAEYGGACRESGDVALAWRSAGIDVTVLPCNPIKPDNHWPRRLCEAGCKIEEPFLNGELPEWLKDCTVVDFQAERAVRSWPQLKKRGCRLVHVPCHAFVMEHEDSAFRIVPPTAVVCQSMFQRNVLAPLYAAYGINELHRIPAAFEPKFFPFEPREYDGGNFVVGAIGRDDPSKWPARILKVLKAAKARVPKLRGRFLGWTPAVEKWSGKPPDWVQCFPPGYVTSSAFLCDTHALICMSDYAENAPRVVLEAFSSGVPVIADSRGGYFEQIRHGENGFLAANEYAAVELLCEISHDEELRINIVNAARESLVEIAPQATIQGDWMALFASL